MINGSLHTCSKNTITVLRLPLAISRFACHNQILCEAIFIVELFAIPARCADCICSILGRVLRWKFAATHSWRNFIHCADLRERLFFSYVAL